MGMTREWQSTDALAQSLKNARVGLGDAFYGVWVHKASGRRYYLSGLAYHVDGLTLCVAYYGAEDRVSFVRPFDDFMTKFEPVDD